MERFKQKKKMEESKIYGRREQRRAALQTETHQFLSFFISVWIFLDEIWRRKRINFWLKMKQKSKNKRKLN
jgi:hypothetical protein